MTIMVRRATTLLSVPSTSASYPGSRRANPCTAIYGDLRIAVPGGHWSAGGTPRPERGPSMSIDHVFAIVDKRDADGSAALFAP
jgi:hypothetical protein